MTPLKITTTLISLGKVVFHTLALETVIVVHILHLRIIIQRRQQSKQDAVYILFCIKNQYSH